MAIEEEMLLYTQNKQATREEKYDKSLHKYRLNEEQLE
jgi:hypothetical protein